MTFSAFSKSLAALAVAGFSILLCASAPAKDFVPMEDVTQLEKPTICQYSNNKLYLVDWDGQNERVWMTGDFNGPAEWSRDGKHISFIVGSYTLYIMELKTGRLINMTQRLEIKGFEDLNISGEWWFPDGRRLALRVDNRKSAFPGDVYVLNFREATLDQLTATPWKDEYWASVSGDGEKIVFSSNPFPNEIDGEWNPELRPDDIYTMNADGTDVMNLTGSVAMETIPVWSPNGKKIAFDGVDRPEQIEGRRRDVFIMDPDGSNVERITSAKDGDLARVYDWSPDSKWLLFSLKNDNEPVSYLHRRHLETKELVRIATGGNAKWVYAGKSRFLSVNPAGKKKAPWGALKEADSSPNRPTSQDGE